MKKEKCSVCGAPMKRLYERYSDPETKKREWIGVAWRCVNPGCDNIQRDILY